MPWNTTKECLENLESSWWKIFWYKEVSWIKKNEMSNVLAYWEMMEDKEIDESECESLKAKYLELVNYWEKMKAEWKRLKDEFWKNHGRSDFYWLVKYKLNRWNLEIEWDYKYLDKMKKSDKENFIKKYLYDHILYSGKIEWGLVEEHWLHYDDIKWREIVMRPLSVLDCSYCALWKEWVDWDEWAILISKNVELSEGVYLNLYLTYIWVEWLKAISGMKFMPWVRVNLGNNKFWDEWVEEMSRIMQLEEWMVLKLDWNNLTDKSVKAIAKNMNFKRWMTLDLSHNGIWDKWVEALSKSKSKVGLPEGFTLNLYDNDIWDAWAEALMQNLELKNWVKIHLWKNRKISLNVRKKLVKWVQDYNKRWIKCKLDLLDFWNFNNFY